MSRRIGMLVAVLAELPPVAGSAVMATAIISTGLQTVGRHLLSLIALAIGGALWLILAGDFALRLVRQRVRFRAEAATPPALTGVAATAVLGTRLAAAGHTTIAEALLALGALVWPFITAAVLHAWTRRMPGGIFLVCVGTESLAVLCAVLGAGEQRWLAQAALALFVLGLVLYCGALLHFDPRQIRTGLGDHWICGGALAICALAGSKLTAAPYWTGAAHSALRYATLVLFFLALAIYLVLVAAEVRWPRPRYDIRRWATVFPLGMIAVASMSTGAAAGVGGLHTLGVIMLWIAVAAWLLTAAGLGALARRRAPAA